MQYEKGINGVLNVNLSTLLSTDNVVSYTEVNTTTQKVHQKALTRFGNVPVTPSAVVASASIGGTTITCDYSKGDVFYINTTISTGYTINITANTKPTVGEGLLLQLNNVQTGASLSYGGAEIFKVAAGGNYSAGKYVISFINISGAVEVLNFIKQP